MRIREKISCLPCPLGLTQSRWNVHRVFLSGPTCPGRQPPPSPSTSALLFPGSHFVQPGVPAWSSSPRCLLSSLPRSLPEFLQTAPCLRGLARPPSSSAGPSLFLEGSPPPASRETLLSTCSSLSFLLKNRPSEDRGLARGPRALKSRPSALPRAADLTAAQATQAAAQGASPSVSTVRGSCKTAISVHGLSSFWSTFPALGLRPEFSHTPPSLPVRGRLLGK